jgi:LysM repeat protein
MADDAPTTGPGRAEAPSAPPPAERAGEFERYALIAALTLVVLCLLAWDRWHEGGSSGPAPRPDRTLRVEIGGDAPAKAPAPARNGGNATRMTNDAPPPPPPPPPPERTHVVKSGETLSEIARRELGSATRANDIAQLNGIDDPTKLKAGTTLKLPAR